MPKNIGVGGRLQGTVSIKGIGQAKVEKPRLQVEVKPLTVEELQHMWQETAEELNLAELMKDGVVKLGEKTGLFEVDAQTTWFHDEFKQHKLEVMEMMRRKSGMPMLDCKVNPLFVEKEEVIYSPDKKFQVMVGRNPVLYRLRKLLPNIDY